MPQKVFTEASTRRRLSPWGLEVKRRLLDLQMQQDELVKTLREQGFEIDKFAFSNLLYGHGTSSRQKEIEAISRILEIPYRPTM